MSATSSVSSTPVVVTVSFLYSRIGLAHMPGQQLLQSKEDRKRDAGNPFFTTPEDWPVISTPYSKNRRGIHGYFNIFKSYGTCMYSGH